MVPVSSVSSVDLPTEGKPAANIYPRIADSKAMALLTGLQCHAATNACLTVLLLTDATAQANMSRCTTQQPAPPTDERDTAVAVLLHLEAVAAALAAGCGRLQLRAQLRQLRLQLAQVILRRLRVRCKQLSCMLQCSNTGSWML